MLDSPTISISRQVSFSCGLRLHQKLWSERANADFYGKRARPHGANFRLLITLSGPISPRDGMIVNLVDVKARLAQIVKPLEDAFLNHDVEVFDQKPPTLENIALYLWDQMPDHIGVGLLSHLELHQNSHRHNHGVVEISPSTMKVSHSYEFAAAHRLFTPALSLEENWAKFDKCSNPAGHGHNFQLWVWVEGTPDPETGYVIAPRLLDDIVEQEIYERFDHRHLNEDCPEFFGTAGGLVPTSENLALVIFGLMKERLYEKGYRLCKIGLQETQKNYFEVEA